jgi:hypothetical protein
MLARLMTSWCLNWRACSCCVSSAVGGVASAVADGWTETVGCVAGVGRFAGVGAAVS